MPVVVTASSDHESLSVSDLRKEVSYYMGYGRTWSSLSSDQQDFVDDLVQAGYRQFLYPANGYQFSFMTPTTTLSIDSETETLPAAFGGFLGPVTYDDYADWIIKVVHEGLLRQHQQQYEDRTGRPEMMCVRPTGSETAGEGFTATFFPIPDTTYTAHYTYRARVHTLSSSPYPYPLGGAQHGETLIASCLAIAELRRMEARGAQWEQFQERLAASIAADMRIARPPLLGPNLDPGIVADDARRVRQVTVTLETS